MLVGHIVDVRHVRIELSIKTEPSEYERKNNHKADDASVFFGAESGKEVEHLRLATSSLNLHEVR